MKKRTFASDESGQDLVEYGLLASLIATFLIGAMNVFGDQIDAFYTVIVARIPF